MRGLLACVLLASAPLGCGKPESEPPPPPTVEVATPETRDVTEYFFYTGALEPVASVEIRARVPGFLEQMHFEESTQVEAGDLMFTIEKAAYEVAVGQAEAAVARAVAARSLAEARTARVQQAFDQNAANELELLEVQAELEQAKANVLAAEEELRAARLDLSYTDVTTPIAGRVDRNYVDVGNLVGRDGPTLLATVNVLDPLHVMFDVSESIVLRYLEVGQDSPREAGFPTVEVALADEEGYPHIGRVDFADNAVDEATGTLQVRAILPNPTGKLFPGLFARIRVPWEVREDAVLIREEAVGTGLEGKYVFVVNDDGTTDRRAITLGERQSDGTIVVLEGLSPSDRYIVRGIQKVRPGARVAPKPFEEEQSEASGEPEPSSTADTPADDGDGA